MRAQQVILLCLVACLACVALAEDKPRMKVQVMGYDEDHEYEYKKQYSHSPKHTKEYKKEKEEYEKEDKYSSKDKYSEGKDKYSEGKDKYSEGKDKYSGGKDGYSGDKDGGYVEKPDFYHDKNYGDYRNPREYKSNYLPQNPDGTPHLMCQDYHSWPEEWENWLCLDLTHEGRKVIKQVKTTDAECSDYANGKDGKWCTPSWPNTEYSCLFKLAKKTQQCGYPRGPCEKEAFCRDFSGTGSVPASGPTCDFEFYGPNDICKHVDGDNPCDVEDKCTAGDWTCPPKFKDPGTKCLTVNTTAFPCRMDSTCGSGDKEGVCKSNWRDSDYVCRKASGDCDLEDKCPGDGSSSGLCTDKVIPWKDQHVCNPAADDNSCVMGGVCDGKVKTCPPVKYAPDGTPCRKDGLYQEALTSSGSVAVKGHYPADQAKAHGWTTCNRCYEGQCQEFKWEFWGGGEGGDYKEDYHKGGEYKDVDKDDYSYAKYPSKTVYKKKSSKYYSKSHNKHNSYKKQYHKSDKDYDYYKPPSPPPKPPTPPPPPPPKPTPPPPPPPSKKYDKYDKDSGKYDEDSKYDDDKYSGYDKYDEDSKYDDEDYYKEYYPTKIFETSDKVALQNYGYYGGSPIEPELYCVPYKKDD